MVRTLQIFFGFALLLIVLASTDSDNELIECKGVGRFRDPQDCRNFIECDCHSVPQVRSCPAGFAFDDKFQRCSDKVKGCSVRQGKSIASNPQLNHLCSSRKVYFTCSNCATQVICGNGRAYENKCSSSYCLKDDILGGYCSTSIEPQGCNCTGGIAEFRIDAYDPRSFRFCPASMDSPIEYHLCPPDTIFDEDVSECVREDGLPECTKQGIYAFSENCTNYYTCVSTRKGYAQKAFVCGNGDYFQESSRECVDPCKLKVSPFKCNSTIIGRFSEPSDCSVYYECVPDNTGIVPEEPRTKRCINGLVWKQLTPNAGACLDRSQYECKPAKQQECSFPEAIRCPEQALF